MIPEIKTEKIEDLLFKDTKPILEIKIEYPQIYGHIPKNCENRFNTRYIKSTAKSNLYVRTELYKSALDTYKSSIRTGFPFNFMTFERCVHTNLNNGNLISIYFDTYKYERGAHGMTTRTSETWNVANGEIMPLCIFFVKGFNFRKFITEIISAQISENLNNKESVYYKNAPERCKQLFSEKRYFLSDTGFLFYYPSYSVAPYCAGIQTFEIPFEKFGKNLKFIPEKIT